MKMNIRFLLLLGGLWAFVGVQAQNLRPEANEKGKFGYVDDQGKKVISYKYDEASPFEEGLAKVKKGTKYGFIDPEGKAVGKIKYTLILPFNGSFCRVAVGGSYKDGVLDGVKWGFLNKRGEEILPAEFEEIGEFEDGVTYVIKGNKYGLIDDQAKFLLEPKYTAVGLFDKFGHCWFAESGKLNKKTGKLSGARYGIINKSGKVVIPAKYGSLGYFYRFREKGKQQIESFNAGLSNALGMSALEKPLRRLFDPQNYLNAILSTAKTAEKADSLREMFNLVEFVPEADYLYYTKAGVQPKGLMGGLAFSATSYTPAVLAKFGVMSSRGDVLIPEKKFDEVNCPSDGIALVGKVKKKKMNYGYYNIESGYLKEFKANETLYSYVDGVGQIQNKDDKTSYFVDKSGNRITDIYRLTTGFDRGLCIVQDNANGKYGVIDNKGQTVIPFEYDAVRANFSEDLLGVCKNEQWGAVDRTGNLVIPMSYKGIADFKFGWAAAFTGNDKWGIIDKTNQAVLNFEWENLKVIEEADQQLVWVMKNSLWHCYDRAKNSLAFQTGYQGAFNFKEVEALNGRYAVVLQNDKFGAIDVAGNIVVPFVLDNPANMRKLFDYMVENGKTALNSTDAFRLNIREDAATNAYRITDKIPDEKWDY